MLQQPSDTRGSSLVSRNVASALSVNPSRPPFSGNRPVLAVPGLGRIVPCLRRSLRKYWFADLPVVHMLMFHFIT